MQPLNEAEDKYVKGWSWGAFFVPWVFLYINKQNKLAWKFLVVFIINMFLQFAPWLDIMSLKDVSSYSGYMRIIYLGLAIWVGVRGREMVWKSGVFASVGDFQLKQKLVTKINIFVIILTIATSGFMMYSLVKPYIGNPELADQKVMQEALADAKTRYGNSINDAEFEQGYQKGHIDGGNINSITSFVGVEANSYQRGYYYGFLLSCMKISSNDQVLCLKKVMGK